MHLIFLYLLHSRFFKYLMRWPCHAAGVGTTIIVSAGPTPSLEFFAGKTSRGLSRCLVRVGFQSLD